MYLASIITTLLSIAAQVAMAFHIPEGQPDGVYSVQQLDNGTEVHTRIGNLPRTVRHRSSIGDDFSSDMPIYNVKCFPEEGLEDRRAASLEITGQCGRYKPGQALKMIQSTLDETYYKYVYGYESYCTPQGHDFCGLATAGD